MERDITKVIRNTASKYCELDPMPIELLKDTLDNIALLIEAIVNKSVINGEFCDSLKEVLVPPFLKKANLDLVDKNYCPESNLTFLSKVIDRVALS